MKVLLTAIFLYLFSNIANSSNLNISPPDTIVHANLQITKFLFDVGNGRYYDWMITAGFFNSSSPVTTTITGVEIDNVRLKYNEKLNGNYTDTTGLFLDTLRTWKVQGQGIIPSFTFTPMNLMPDFMDYLLVPNSIYLNSGVTIPFSGITNATHITIVITDGEHYVSEIISPISSSQSRLTTNSSVSGNSIQILPSDLSSLVQTNTGTIEIIIANVDYQVFNGVKVAFTKTFFYKKDKISIQ